LQVLRIIQEEAMKENTAAIHTQVPVEVAAFLLNEKRAEVIKIESRFKVNVLMIPNKHLETPHYKLERLRHDDPRLDDQKASYVMAEEAARELETDTAVSRKDADVKVRPEAAVKGITPNVPAPVSQPRPARTEKVQAEAASTGGFFGFIKNLFSSSPAPEVKPAPSAPRGRNQNNRNGNGSDNNRNRGRRGERNDRGERPAEVAVEGAEGASAPREAGSGRGRQDGRSRNNRNQNNPKPENQAAVTPATEAAPGTDATPSADGEERRGRGRNRRGRGRGQRGERTESTGDAAIDSVVAVATSLSGTPVGMGGASASMPIQNIAQSFGNTVAPVASSEVKERAPRAPREPREQRAPRQSNSTDNAALASNPVATPAAAPAPAIQVIAKPTPELPKVAFQALEETPLHSVVQSAGMVWVATDSSKHQEAQSQITAEPEILPVGRTPKAAVSLQNGPMVLVETGGQEKTV
jgi:ribonuclease E